MVKSRSGLLIFFCSAALSAKRGSVAPRLQSAKNRAEEGFSEKAWKLKFLKLMNNS